MVTENHTASRHDHDSDDVLRDVLNKVKIIALVGASDKTQSPQYHVTEYLQSQGYRVIPVNPRLAGQAVLGEAVYPTLADIPGPVDMVDIFRNSEAAGPITDAAIAKGASYVWMQLTVRNDEAAHRARAAGLTVVMDRCPKIEHRRLFGTPEPQTTAPVHATPAR
ncbi:MAG: CoA-binding protein [Azospirillaceae bacterium]|nr:CoA-binding protein [Azospirillaceae bacterium]